MDFSVEIRMAADNLALWHESSLHALGHSTWRDETLWSHAPPTSLIYFSLIALGSQEDADSQRASVLSGLEEWFGGPYNVCDTWHNIDLAPHGFDLVAERTWSVRSPAALTVDYPDQLRIDRVTTPADLADWEYRSLWGFGGTPPDPHDNTVFHAPGILDDSRMYVLAGRVEDEIVCGAMVYEGEEAAGMYGVFTLPGHRGRGYGAAISAAAVSLFPDRPMTTEPSESAARIYRRIGFRDVGGYRIWSRG